MATDNAGNRLREAIVGTQLIQAAIAKEAAERRAAVSTAASNAQTTTEVNNDTARGGQ